MKFLSTFFSLLFILLTGCKFAASDKVQSAEKNADIKGQMEYAKKFFITDLGENKLLKVSTPWQNGSERSFNYLLGKTKNGIPDSLKHLPLIKTPVTSAIIMSATFIPFIDTLQELSVIKGVSGTSFIFNRELRKMVEAGDVRDVGYDHNLNYELIIELNPDVIFMFGVESGVVQTINKLEEIGIPVVICADYLEPHPLGRGEWLKFFSAFFDKEELADSIFNGISVHYNELKEMASGTSENPEIMLGLPWKDAWYVAGGNSFAATLIEDAGGSYLFRDEYHTEARPFSIEAVFSRAVDADIWINPGVVTNLKQLTEHDNRFQMLNAWKRSAIFNNTKRINAGGGNDYWEYGVLRPDLVLHDLITIFHSPEIHKDSLYFYSQLQ